MVGSNNQKLTITPQSYEWRDQSKIRRPTLLQVKHPLPSSVWLIYRARQGRTRTLNHTRSQIWIRNSRTLDLEVQKFNRRFNTRLLMAKLRINSRVNSKSKKNRRLFLQPKPILYWGMHQAINETLLIQWLIQVNQLEIKVKLLIQML